MLAPVNRDQSPISTARANPVSVEMPRRQHSRRVTGVNSLSAASAVICSSRRCAAEQGQRQRLQVGVVGGLGAGPLGAGEADWSSHASCLPVQASPP